MISIYFIHKRNFIFILFLNNAQSVIVDPAFQLMHFPLDGELDFDFEK